MLRRLFLIVVLSLLAGYVAEAHRVISPAIVGTTATAPGGNDSEVQYNDNGSLGGDANITWNDTSDTLTVNGTITATTITGTSITSAEGRGSFVICGEATTVNDNTVYYGPDLTLAADNEGLNCDINASGDTTEADADGPVYTNQAFQVLSMTCRNENDANADISFTLRTEEGATDPSVTCTIADGERDCVANIQTTTPIGAGDTVAIAAASAGDIGPNNGFICTVRVSFPSS